MIEIKNDIKNKIVELISSPLYLDLEKKMKHDIIKKINNTNDRIVFEIDFNLSERVKTIIYEKFETNKENNT